MSIAADQVSSLSIIFMVLTGVIVFAFPIGLAVWAKRRYRAAFSFIPLLGGVLAFFISQEIIRLPIVQLLLPTLPWFQSLMKVSWAYFLFMSFTAGLVEEPARYIVFSILKQRRSFTDGLSYGIGHGGIEAILLVGITYISNLFLSLAINSGNLGALGSQLPSTVISALTDTPSYLFAVAGIERIFCHCTANCAVPARSQRVPGEQERALPAARLPHPWTGQFPGVDPGKPGVKVDSRLAAALRGAGFRSLYLDHCNPFTGLHPPAGENLAKRTGASASASRHT